jgi:hypothetical protein
MIISGNRRYGSLIHISTDSISSIPERVSLTEREFNEGWIQELIRSNPELLPVGDIEPAFDPPICIGREVRTAAGPIDNLYISPQGYLTIVETKLWRNPEARREVIGQIIDYAKEVSKWSYEDLDRRVKEYNANYNRGSLDLIGTLRQMDGAEDLDEISFVDRVSRNLQQGRFLLLIAGDGIKEGVEAMAEYINSAPQLQFTLALVELEIYKMDNCEPGALLVIPHVVTRTREITRAVVKIEGASIQHVSIDIDAKPDDETRTQTRSTLTEQDYFEILSEHVGNDEIEFARQIMKDMEELGCNIVWWRSAYVVKLPDPAGSSRSYTMFVVTKRGYVYPGWLDQQSNATGIPVEIGREYVRMGSDLFKNCKPKPNAPDSWTRSVTLKEFSNKYDEFTVLVQDLIDQIKQATEKNN